MSGWHLVDAWTPVVLLPHWPHQAFWQSSCTNWNRENKFKQLTTIWILCCNWNHTKIQASLHIKRYLITYMLVYFSCPKWLKWHKRDPKIWNMCCSLNIWAEKGCEDSSHMTKTCHLWWGFWLAGNWYNYNYHILFLMDILYPCQKL